MRLDKDKVLIRLILCLQERTFIYTNKQCKNKPEVCMGSIHQATVCMYYPGRSNYYMRAALESDLLSI